MTTKQTRWPDSENCAACLNRHGTIPVSSPVSSGYGVTTIEELFCPKCAADSLAKCGGGAAAEEVRAS